jgi:hypothetical protein
MALGLKTNIFMVTKHYNEKSDMIKHNNEKLAILHVHKLPDCLNKL